MLDPDTHFELIIDPLYKLLCPIIVCGETYLI